MSEISEYETRITAALERIGRAVATVEERQAADAAGGIATEEMTAEMGRLQEALETEREANAQLEERVKAIHETQQSRVASLEDEVENLRNQLMIHDGETQKLRRVNAQLRENNTALREANMTAIADPSLINTALMNELESLKAGREADMAELGAIRAELQPLIEAAAPVAAAAAAPVAAEPAAAPKTEPATEEA